MTGVCVCVEIYSHAHVNDLATYFLLYVTFHFYTFNGRQYWEPGGYPSESPKWNYKVVKLTLTHAPSETDYRIYSTIPSLTHIYSSNNVVVIIINIVIIILYIHTHIHTDLYKYICMYIILFLVKSFRCIESNICYLFDLYRYTVWSTVHRVIVVPVGWVGESREIVINVVVEWARYIENGMCIVVIEYVGVKFTRIQLVDIVQYSKIKIKKIKLYVYIIFA